MTIATLWIGESLGALERACLRSVIREGHEVHLYCYCQPAGVPEGVTLRDAAEVLPQSAIIRHDSGSVSLFSNRFRYELQARSLGTWLDCDVYLLKPLDMTSPYLMGEYEPRRYNGAILRLPPDSPLLDQLLSPFEERKVPKWLRRRHKIPAYWRLMTTGRTGITRMPWGSLGPHALTALVPKAGLSHLMQPPEIFYPVHWRDADWIRRSERSLDDMIGEKTVAIHLWNEFAKHFKEEPAARGSFLHRLQQEGS